MGKNMYFAATRTTKSDTVEEKAGFHAASGLADLLRLFGSGNRLRFLVSWKHLGVNSD
jgi:hypothetical protein